MADPRPNPAPANASPPAPRTGDIAGTPQEPIAPIAPPPVAENQASTVAPTDLDAGVESLLAAATQTAVADEEAPAPSATGPQSDLDAIVADALQNDWTPASSEAAQTDQGGTSESADGKIVAAEANVALGEVAASAGEVTANAAPDATGPGAAVPPIQPIDESVANALDAAQSALDELVSQVGSSPGASPNTDFQAPAVTPEAGPVPPHTSAAAPEPASPAPTPGPALPAPAVDSASIDSEIAAEAANVDDEFADAASILATPKDETPKAPKPEPKPTAQAEPPAAPAAANPLAATPPDAASNAAAAMPASAAPAPSAEPTVEVKRRGGLVVVISGLAAFVFSPLFALAVIPKAVHQTIGWIALGTLFNAGAIWAAVLTMSPSASTTDGPGAVVLAGGPHEHEKGEKSEAAKAPEKDAGHGAPKKAEAGGHGAPKKAEAGGHGAAKKPEAGGHGAKKPDKKDDKKGGKDSHGKPAAKKAAH